MQTIRKKNLNIPSFLLLCSALLMACEKDPVQPPTPVPPPTAKGLTIAFSGESIPFAESDSVVIFIRDQDQWIKKSETMVKGANTYRYLFQGLAAGNYTAELFVYSKERTDGTARQYRIIRNVVLPLAAEVNVQAPTGRFNDNWFQRAVFMYGQRDAVIIVGMDPRDSYFSVDIKGAVAKNIQLQRYAVNLNVLVTGKSITRDLDGVLGYSGYADFMSYVDNMQNKTWTKAAISGWIEQKAGGDIGFDYEYQNN